MKNENGIKNFIEKLKSLNTLIVFIGNGASMEGTLKNEEPYPSFSKFMVDILTNAGKNENQKINEKNAFDYMNIFAEYIEYEHDNVSIYLKKYLDGLPSATHYHLINLLSSLIHIESSIFSRLLFVTTNYDDFIEQTFANSKINYYSTSLLEDKTKIDENFFSAIEDKLKNKIPVILHIFGDLKSEKPIFFQKSMKFHKIEEEFLLELFKNTILSIGYSFSDYNIKDIICLKDSDNMPMYNVSRSDCTISGFSNNPRKIYNTKSRFNEFVIKILNELYKRSNRNTLDKKITYEFENKVITEYENKIKTIPQKYSYDLKFLKWRTSLINKLSLEKTLLKTSNNSIDIDQLYIERKNVINWKSYLKSTENIFLIKGNAGVGKSTFMYMNAKKEDKEISTLKFLISPANLGGTLIEYLEKQFLCQPNQLEILFEHFNNLLEKESNYLLIFIDAINELGEEKAKSIKNEIEDFFKVQWEKIKIVYSCRTYFWKNSLQSSHSSENYFNTEEIKYFTNEELEDAFAKYKKVFNLVGDFKEGLTSDFKEKLKDPLMLRLLSEGYSNKGINIDSQEIRKIPNFAPAVEIFTEYVKLLNARYAHDDIEKFLIKIGELYWDNHDKVLGTMSMNFTLFENLQQDTIKYLKDSNVIYEEDRCIQFSYERLFEFTLGLALVVKENWESHLQKIKAQRIFEIWKESVDANKPYTFNFALKSALIYLSRKSNYDEKNLIKNPSLLNELLHIQDTILPHNIDTTTAKEFRTFTLEILKELLSEEESKEKGYEQLKNNLGEEKFYDIVLEVGRDDLRTIKYQVELLAYGSEEQRRQVTINLLKLCNSEESINLLKESIINSFNETDEESLKGLVYLIPIFINFNKIGISPFKRVKEAILKLIKDFNFLKRKTFRDNLLKALKYVYEKEGKYFFGVARGFSGIDYTWEMGDKEKDLAYELVGLFSMKNIPRIGEQNKECIRFFASEIRYFKDIDTPYSESANIDRMRSWEYFIAKYVVMKFSEKDFNKAVDLLDYLLKKNTWLTYDFVLTTMEFMLRNIHINSKENYDLGLSKMQEWVKLGENKFNEFFFSRLSAEDPLNISFNPLSQIANTMAEIDPKSSFKFLDSYINSENSKKAKIALLSLRKVPRRFPIAGKKSLVNAWNKKVYFDEEYISWLNQFIKELSYIHPKMVYELLNDVDATNEERNKIMNIEITSRTNEYNINMLFLWLLEDDNAMNYIVDLYYKILESDQDTFFNNEFVEWVNSCD